MSLRPLGSRLLIKPDPPATVISGILVPASAEKPPAMTGTVIALGHGPASAQAVRQATLAQVAERFHAVADEVSAAHLQDAFAEVLRTLVQEAASLHDVAVGDCVCFAFTAGTNLTVDGEPYILMLEDDLEAVWTPDEAGVA